MEHNEEEAKRAIDIAEKKLLENDYVGAKKFVYKAESLYPNLDGLEQVLMMIDVFISASKTGKQRPEWYRVLGVDLTADDETVKKRYKKLALLLHPDKNKFRGAEEAFKLVSDAYDQKKESKETKRERSYKHHKPTQPKPNPKPDHKPKPEPKSEPKPESKPEPEPERKREPKSEAGPFKIKVISVFWTVCNRCKTYCEYVRDEYLNKTVPCPNCFKNFVASEITPEIINGRPFIRLSPSTRRKTEHTSSSSSTSASDQKPYKRVKRWFGDTPDSPPSVEKVKTFWTICHRCKTYCKFPRSCCLNKILPCPNCGLDFIAGEIIPEIINGSPVIRLTANFQATSKNTSGPSCAFKAERNFDGSWY